MTPSHSMVWAARLAVIDDQIRDGELHLMRLMPLAWLREGGARFLNMPTCYGPASLEAGLSDRGKQLNVRFTSSFSEKPSRTVLHIPPVKGLEAVTLNGKPLKWTSGTDRIVIQ